MPNDRELSGAVELPPPGRAGTKSQVLPWVIVGGWFVVVILVCASLLARHLVALPRPMGEPALAAALASFRPTHAPLSIVHVLYGDCRCSRLVVDHLVTQPRPEDVEEHVIIVGDDEAIGARLAARGFSVKSVTASQLSALGIESAPMFVVLTSGGDVRYAGGYTERKQGLLPRDREVVASVRAGTTTTVLPVFGCAVSDELKKTINPLRLP
jgi:hypothetical protein